MCVCVCVAAVFSFTDVETCTTNCDIALQIHSQSFLVSAKSQTEMIGNFPQSAVLPRHVLNVDKTQQVPGTASDRQLGRKQLF